MSGRVEKEEGVRAVIVADSGLVRVGGDGRGRRHVGVCRGSDEDRRRRRRTEHMSKDDEVTLVGDSGSGDSGVMPRAVAKETLMRLT